MKISNIIIFLSTILIVLACSPSSNNTSDADTTMPPDQHTSQSSLDWSGTYIGILPCASCEGIKTDLVLNDDMTFSLSSLYMGSGEETFVETGSFSWNEVGNTVILDGLSDRPAQFFVGENILFQLDMDGNRATGELADAYQLKRIMNEEFEPTNSLTDTRFELVELLSKPISRDDDAQARIHLVLSAKDSIASGYAGCNSFSGTFELKEGSRIRFSKIASTLRSCPDMEIETELYEVYEMTDNYNFDGTYLVLNRAKMAPLARFVAVRD